VLVAGANPLRIFIHEQGLTRFATRPYEKATVKNKSKRYMHLTNYAVNKRNPKFNRESGDTGHKRSTHFTFTYLQEMGYDVDVLKADINDAIIKTILTVQPTLAHTYKSVQSDDPYNAM
jgi:tubulin polyglutamylase TTLL6/13